MVDGLKYTREYNTDKGVGMDYLWGDGLLLIRLETTMEQFNDNP